MILIYVFNCKRNKVIDIFPEYRWPGRVLNSYPTEGNDLLQLYYKTEVLSALSP